MAIDLRYLERIAGALERIATVLEERNQRAMSGQEISRAAMQYTLRKAAKDPVSQTGPSDYPNE